MNQEFANIINYYSSKYEFINEEFINKIIKLVLNNDDLDQYIIDTKAEENFGLFKKSVIATYSPASKLIRYNLKKLILEGIKKNKKTFSRIKISNTYLYLFILQSLLHEIEHARQFRKISKITTSEDYILFLELSFLNQASEKIIDMIERNDSDFKVAINTMDYVFKRGILYEFSPSERLADIYAKEQTYDVANFLENFQYHEMMQYDYLESLLRGYRIDKSKKDVIPTKYFFDNMDKPFVWEEIIKNTNDLLELEKIKLGLEVKKESLKEIKKQSDELILKLKK